MPWFGGILIVWLLTTDDKKNIKKIKDRNLDDFIKLNLRLELLLPLAKLIA